MMKKLWIVVLFILVSCSSWSLDTSLYGDILDKNWNFDFTKEAHEILGQFLSKKQDLSPIKNIKSVKTYYQLYSFAQKTKCGPLLHELKKWQDLSGRIQVCGSLKIGGEACINTSKFVDLKIKKPDLIYNKDNLISHKSIISMDYWSGKNIVQVLQEENYEATLEMLLADYIVKIKERSVAEYWNSKSVTSFIARILVTQVVILQAAFDHAKNMGMTCHPKDSGSILWLASRELAEKSEWSRILARFSNILKAPFIDDNHEFKNNFDAVKKNVQEYLDKLGLKEKLGVVLTETEIVSGYSSSEVSWKLAQIAVLHAIADQYSKLFDLAYSNLNLVRKSQPEISSKAFLSRIAFMTYAQGSFGDHGIRLTKFEKLIKDITYAHVSNKNKKLYDKLESSNIDYFMRVLIRKSIQNPQDNVVLPVAYCQKLSELQEILELPNLQKALLKFQKNSQYQTN